MLKTRRHHDFLIYHPPLAHSGFHVMQNPYIVFITTKASRVYRKSPICQFAKKKLPFSLRLLVKRTIFPPFPLPRMWIHSSLLEVPTSRFLSQHVEQLHLPIRIPTPGKYCLPTDRQSKRGNGRLSQYTDHYRIDSAFRHSRGAFFLYPILCSDTVCFAISYYINSVKMTRFPPIPNESSCFRQTKGSFERVMKKSIPLVPDSLPKNPRASLQLLIFPIVASTTEQAGILFFLL